MIGVLIFIISFIFLLSIGLALPENPPGSILPGSLIHDWLEIPISEYLVRDIPAWKWIYTISNAFFWAIIACIVISLAMFFRKRQIEKE